MTYSYTSPQTSQKDAVRFLLQDNKGASNHVFEDEEIEYAIDTWYERRGTLQWVAAMLADTAAARFSGEVSYSADGVSIGLGGLGQQYRDLAASLREQHKSLLAGGFPDAGGISLGEQQAFDIEPFSFGTGMHDDLEAGRQNYGSQTPYFIPEYYPGE